MTILGERSKSLFRPAARVAFPAMLHGAGANLSCADPFGRCRKRLRREKELF